MRPLRDVQELLRWRGPVRVLLLAVRELFSPVLYWYAWHIFQTDLSKSSPTPHGEDAFTVRMYLGRDEINTIKQSVASLGELSPAEIDLRAARGDAVGVAFARSGEAVGYSWMTFATGLELAFGTVWKIRPDEAVLYGSYVLPKWRGRGVHSWLDAAVNGYARQRGLVRTIGSMAVLNSGTLRLAERSHKQKVMTVLLVRFRGVGWRYRKAFGAPLESHFETPADDLAAARRKPPM